MSEQTLPIIGAHVSCAGGPERALERALELEFQAIQIHPSSPQTWAKPTVTPEQAAAFRSGCQEAGIRHTFFHNIYLTNFASPSQPGWHGSLEISKSYMKLAASMGVTGVVTHLGSHKGAGMETVLERVAEGIRRVLEESPSESTFLIENTAGAGGTIGRTLEEIQAIMEAVGSSYPNLAICIDTCHAFASGIPIHTTEGLEAFLAEFKERFGLEKLYCLHTNDSKGGFASNRDRHENIGDGEIGSQPFARLLQHPSLSKVPFVMEVPGLADQGPDAANRDRLRTLARQPISS